MSDTYRINIGGGVKPEVFDSLTRLTGSLNSIIGGLPALAGLFSLSAMTNGLRVIAEADDKLDKLNVRLGLSIEDLSRLDFMADRSGVSLETFSSSAAKLSQWLVKNGQGSKDLMQAFTELSAEMQRTPEGPMRLNLALERLGKSGAELIPMLAEGPEVMRELAERADQLGSATQRSAAESAKYLDAISDLKRAMNALGRDVASNVLPPLTALINTASESIIVFRKLNEQSHASRSALPVQVQLATAFWSRFTGQKAEVAGLQEMEKASDELASTLSRIIEMRAKEGLLTAEQTKQLTEQLAVARNISDVRQRSDAVRMVSRQVRAPETIPAPNAFSSIDDLEKKRRALDMEIQTNQLMVRAASLSQTEEETQRTILAGLAEEERLIERKIALLLQAEAQEKLFDGQSEKVQQMRLQDSRDLIEVDERRRKIQVANIQAVIDAERRQTEEMIKCEAEADAFAAKINKFAEEQIELENRLTLALADANAQRLESIEAMETAALEGERQRHERSLTEITERTLEGTRERYRLLEMAAQVHESNVTSIQREADARRKAKEKQEEDDRERIRNMQLASTRDMFGNMAQAASVFAGEGSAAFKAFATAQAVMSTAMGAIGAFSQASLSFPPPFGQIIGGVAAGAVVAAGAAQIAKINGAFYEGGYTGDISRTSVAGQVHGQEYVIPANRVDQWGVGFFEGIRTGDISPADLPTAPQSGQTNVSVGFIDSRQQLREFMAGEGYRIVQSMDSKHGFRGRRV